MIPCQRDLFEIPRDVAYFNCAYMSPLMRPALDAGEAGLRRKATPWRLSPSDFFTETERARALFAGLMGAEAEGVAIVPSVSYGIGIAARNLPLRPGSRIVTLADQFPSNVYPWRRAAAEAGAEVIAVDLARTEDATGAVVAAINDRCAVAALPQVLWTTGAALDLERIGEAVRSAGGALALDLTQSAGAMPIDFARVRPDFAVAACYKWLLGPYSIGFLYAAPHRRAGVPLEEGWIAREGSEDFSGLVDYRDGYQPGARRYDMGERANFALTPAAIAALERIAGWGVEAVAETLGARTAAIAARLAPLGLAPTPDDRRGPHYLAAALPPGAPDDLPARLAARGVHVSRRGSSLRITPHLYNDDADVDRLIAALGEAL